MNIILNKTMTTQENNPEVEYITNINKNIGQNFVTIINKIDKPYILMQVKTGQTRLMPYTLNRMLDIIKSSNISMVYGDYIEKKDTQTTYHPTSDFQLGSVRDDFDFGAFILLNTELSQKAIAAAKDTKYCAFYAFWLQLSTIGAIIHLNEAIAIWEQTQENESKLNQFAYVDSKNRVYQQEAEKIFTQHLINIGAYLPPRTAIAENFDNYNALNGIVATVVIPVKNRQQTIADAISSALNQKTNFKYNIIVVNNHSTDKTTEILETLKRQNPQKIIVIEPMEVGLGIGGCWNVAIQSNHCGKFAIQLDSDDVYSNQNVLQQIVDVFEKEKAAMIIGSYQLTDINYKPLPPGIIDHKEYTQENGHNNALRVNGLGAPRCFFTPLLRLFPLPNSSYGEDYATALRICREYKISRIYDVLYLCRRWNGNSDAAPSAQMVAHNNQYKDFLRSIEISARQTINKLNETSKK